jgi:hypothetical protein
VVTLGNEGENFALGQFEERLWRHNRTTGHHGQMRTVLVNSCEDRDYEPGSDQIKCIISPGDPTTLR